MREEGGAVALGPRADPRGHHHDRATRRRPSRPPTLRQPRAPMRIIVLAERRPARTRETRLDAQIRVGGDAGASEVIVLRGYGELATRERVPGHRRCCCRTPRSWPGGRTACPRTASATSDRPDRAPPDHRLGQRARPAGRRWSTSRDTYAAGDTDLAWTRLTHWRAQLAAVLDQPPSEPVTARRRWRAPATPPARCCWPRGCTLCPARRRSRSIEDPAGTGHPPRAAGARQRRHRTRTGPAPIVAEL